MSTSARRTISVVGTLNTDLMAVVPRLPEVGEGLLADSFSEHPGGMATVTAIACYRLSHSNPNNIPFSAARMPKGSITHRLPGLEDLDINVHVTGAVGSDSFGQTLISTLTAHHIDTTGIRTIPGAGTGVAMIVVEADYGQNRIILHPRANEAMLPADFKTPHSLFGSGSGALLPDLLVTQLGLKLETVMQVLETAQAAGVPILLNPAPAKSVDNSVYEMVEHIILNKTEAAWMTGRELAELEDPVTWQSVTDDFLEMGCKNVVLIVGSQGAYFSAEVGRGEFIKSEQNGNAVDMTGVTSTYVGAYAVEYVRQKHLGEPFDVKKAVQYACKASNRTMERVGAVDSIPWADEVEPKLKILAATTDRET